MTASNPTWFVYAVTLTAAAGLVAAVMWVREWRSQPTGPGARGWLGKAAFGRSSRDTIGLATAAGIVLAEPLAAELVKATARLAGITGLDAAAWAPASADVVVLALVGIAVLDGVAVGLCDVAPRPLVRLFERLGAGVLTPALRHSIIGLLLPALLVAGVPLLAQTTSDAVAAVGQVPEPAVCAPTDLEGDTIAGYGPARLANADVIEQVGRDMGVPERGRWIAIATAMQESSLDNLDYGDRDSLGLFQQRPSQGWGSPSQVRDPAYAATQFYDRLLEIPDWPELPLWQAAQAVQRSAYPTAYSKHEDAAALVLGAVAGTTCTTETRS